MTPDLHAGVNPGMAARHLGLAMLSFAGFFALIYYITPEKPFIPRVSLTASLSLEHLILAKPERGSWPSYQPIP